MFEGEVEKAAAAFGVKPYGTVGQTIQAILAVKQLANIDEKRYTRICDALKSADDVRKARADIVHSKLRIIDFDGEIAGLFVNTRQSTEFGRSGRIVTQHDFIMLHRQIHRAEQVLRSALNPPSRPQPVPAATTDP